MEEIQFDNFGIMLLRNDNELYALIKKLRKNEIVRVVNQMGDYSIHYNKSRIFVRIKSYTLPKYGFFKNTPGEVVAELPDGTTCPLLNIKYSGDYIIISLSNEIQNKMREIADKIDSYSRREQLPSYRYLIKIYGDNIELKNDMEEHNRSMVNLETLKEQLEKEDLLKAAEEKRKQDEYNEANNNAKTAVNDMFNRM